MNDALLSVIVPVYNVEKYIDECIESICNQTYKNLEIILVDDGSTDNSGKRCDYWAEQDNRIKVIHKQNGGISSARNAALDIASGEYVAFVDSDDLIMPTMYQEMIDNITDDKSIVVCDYEIIDESGNSLGCESNILMKNEYTPQDFLVSVYKSPRIHTNVVVAWNKIYSKEFFDNVRYTDGFIHEDEEIIHRLVLSAKRIVFIARKLYLYRIRSGSIMHSENKGRAIYKYIALRNRLYDCKNANFTKESLSLIATDYINQGIRCWRSYKKGYCEKIIGKGNIRKEVLDIIKERKNYGIMKQEIKWICFKYCPNILLIAYRICGKE